MDTDGSLERWVGYKRTKAVAFVEAGYSVEWLPDADNWMHVYRPERQHADPIEPGIHASVKCHLFGDKAPYGTQYGKIDILEIARIERAKAGQADKLSSERERRFFYDRGHTETDRLSEDSEARKLHDIIVKELR